MGAGARTIGCFFGGLLVERAPVRSACARIRLLFWWSLGVVGARIRLSFWCSGRGLFWCSGRGRARVRLLFGVVGAGARVRLLFWWSFGGASTR